MPNTKIPPADPHVSILLVDANLAGSAARKLILEKVGYQVEIAESGKDDVEMLSKDRNTVVVCDFRLPGMQGPELIRILRELEPRLAVIVLSGLSSTLGLTPEATGADVVLQKSASELTQLKRAVAKLAKPSRKPARKAGTKTRPLRKATGK